MMNFTQVRPGVPRGVPIASGCGPGTPGAKRPVARLVVRVIGVGGAGCSSLARLSEFLPGDTRFLNWLNNFMAYRWNDGSLKYWADTWWNSWMAT